jgi:hypothetical protein
MRRTSLTDVGFMKNGEHDGDGLNLRAQVSLGRDLSVSELPHVCHWPTGRDRARRVEGAAAFDELRPHRAKSRCGDEVPPPRRKTRPAGFEPATLGLEGRCSIP